MMEVILLERVPHLGQMGETVRVRPGFARNYLIPQKKALRATEGNKKLFERQRVRLEALNLERKSEAEAVAQRMDGLSVTLIRKAGDTGQLYGSVTNRDLAEAIVGAGVAIERRQIELDAPIKELGLHPVRIVLHPEVMVSITANVARSEDEAMRQAGIEPPREAEEEPTEAEAEAAGDETAA